MPLQCEIHEVWLNCALRSWEFWLRDRAYWHRAIEEPEFDGSISRILQISLKVSGISVKKWTGIFWKISTSESFK